MERSKRALGAEWLLPALDDTNRAYFTSEELTIQACAACEKVQHPPEDLCRACGSHALAPRAVAGAGRIESAVVVHHAVHPLLAGRVPYAVVVVSLDDAPEVYLVGNVIDVEPASVEIGARVQVVFETVVDEASGHTLRIPQWRLAPD